MQTKLSYRTPLLALIIAFACAAITSWLLGNILSPSLDEGIYLNGGHRIVGGQIIYRDFFAFAGPLTYWLVALLETLAGRSIPSLRVLTALSVGCIAASVFVLVRRLAGLRAGLVAAAFWFGITLDLWNRLEVNHRWLSMAFYSIAVIAFFLPEKAGRRSAAVAGSALALAAWTTQSFAWPLALVAVYLLACDRRLAWPFLGAAAITAALPAIALGWQGALSPMIENLRWIAVNYADANRVPYGYFFRKTPLRYLPHIVLSISMAPLVVILGVIVVTVRKQRDFIFPLVLVLAVFPTSYPKWDALQMQFLTGPFFALLIAMIWRQLPEKAAPIAQALLLMPTAFFVLHIYSLSDAFTNHPSRAGNLMGSPENVAAMEKLEEAIPAGSKVFVYPYLTAVYPLLKVENPTRYEYLQPGMMTERDEKAVVEDLQRSPAQFIFWHNFPDTEIMKIWPNTDPMRLRFPAMEEYIRANYDPAIEIVNSHFAGRVWTRKQ